MLARCRSASLQGLEARPVTVEVDLAPGLPGIQLVVKQYQISYNLIQGQASRARRDLRQGQHR